MSPRLSIFFKGFKDILPLMIPVIPFGIIFGAIAVELEVVPVEVATELAKRTSLLVWSMGAGAGCDAQYLFSNDILGYTEGHIPRHSKVYRNFRAEYDRLQLERISAFKEFVNDVDTGVFPETSHLVHMDDDELDRFFEGLDKV